MTSSLHGVLPGLTGDSLPFDVDDRSASRSSRRRLTILQESAAEGYCSGEGAHYERHRDKAESEVDCRLPLAANKCDYAERKGGGAFPAACRVMGTIVKDSVRRWIAWIGCVVVLLFAAPLAANGRYPEAQKLIEDPRDANRLLLSGTYGLLESEDRGQNWYYLCELAFANELIEGDPLIELLPSGEILSGLIATLNRSGDCGCSWTTRLAQPEPEVLRDLTVEKAGDRAAIALIRDVGANPEVFSLHESKDAGLTWTKLADLPPDVEEAFTLDSAPSDASRIYVSALMKSGAGALLVSTNRGASWQTRNFAGADINNQAYIAAVDPANADVVFVRTNGWDDESFANDALFYTSDGGQTWTELIRRQGKLFGFALSPDRSIVLAGYGDPYQAASFVNPEDLGLYKAAVGQTTFTKIWNAAVSCLSWTSRGVYACHAEGHPEFTVDFSLGVAANADFTLTTPAPFTPLLRHRDVRGPLGCLGGICDDTWSVPTELGPPVCDQFGAQCTPAARSSAPPCGSGSATGGSSGMGGTAGATGSAGSAVDAGVGASGATAGSGGAGGTLGTGGNGGAGPAASGGDESGCGCRTMPASPAGSWTLVLAFLASWIWRRKGVGRSDAASHRIAS